MVSAAHGVRLSGYVPPRSALVARHLWASGVRSALALQHAERWGMDGARAWRECDRLDLVIPLARVRGASIDDLTRLAARWIRSVGCHGVAAAERIDEYLREATAPDIDLARLDALRHQVLEDARLVGRAPREALAATLSLGMQRVRRPVRVGADGEVVASRLLAMLASWGYERQRAWAEAQIEHARASIVCGVP